MAELRLIISPDPRHLLEAAADGFLTPLEATDDNPFPTPQYLLALRQGGLRDDLIRLAAERGVKGWFDPPLVIFHELPEWLGHTERKPLGDYERLVLLGAVLQQTAGNVLGRIHRIGAFVDAVDRLFGELVSEGVTAGQFSNAAGQREGDEFELARDRELAAVYAAYLDVLEKENRRDGRDTYVDCARAVQRNADGLAQRLGRRREIRIFGLHDLRGGWRTLLAALRASPALDRIILYAGDETLLDEGLTDAVEHLTGTPRFGVEPPADGKKSSHKVDLICAPDIDREIEEVARRVRALAEGGVPLHRIAVVSRKARPHVDIAVDVLERMGVPATARRRIGFTEIPAVRAVSALFEAAAQGWTRRALVNLAAQPYYANDFDTRVVNYLGYTTSLSGLDAWLEALRELEAKAQASEGQEEGAGSRHRRALPNPVRITKTREALERFAAHVHPTDTSRPLTEWVAWLDDLLDADPLEIERRIYTVPEHRYDIARLDIAGWNALRGVLREWRKALELWADDDAPLDAAQFHERLQDVLSGDAALWTPTRRGVLVLEGLAAMYRPVDHLFVVGMESGRFPSPPPRSTVLDEADRTALREAGLPLEGATVWEAREQSLFRSLLSGARTSTTLSYVTMDERGELQVPSAFVEAVEDAHEMRREDISPERVITPDYPLFSTPAVAEQAAHAAVVERVRETGMRSPYSGTVEDASILARLAERFGDDYLWSPTQLEQYAQCPWGWFSARLLRLEKLDDPDQEMDHATRGTVLHDALKRFFDMAAKRKGGPVFLMPADADWVHEFAEVALDDAIAAAKAETWVGQEVLLPAKREELKRIMLGYLEWEIELHDKMTRSNRGNAPKMVRTAVKEHEMGFHDAVLERGGVRFRYRGWIDRVEVGCDERVDSAHFVAAVDYKTTRYSTPGAGESAAWDDDVVLQVPLYAHALRKLMPGAEVARVEYRALKGKGEKAVHRLQLYEVDWKTNTLVEQDDAQEKFERALDAVPRLVLSVRSGRFPVDLAESCSCPSWCHGKDICRAHYEPKGWQR